MSIGFNVLDYRLWIALIDNGMGRTVHGLEQILIKRIEQLGPKSWAELPHEIRSLYDDLWVQVYDDHRWSSFPFEDLKNAVLKFSKKCLGCGHPIGKGLWAGEYCTTQCRDDHRKRP